MVPGVVDAASFPGADEGAQISTAIAALPTGGGVVDARNLVGACSIGTTITVDRPVQLLLGAATYVTTAVDGLEINACNFSVIGLARGTTALQMGAIATQATGRAVFAPSGVWSDAANDPFGGSSQ